MRRFLIIVPAIVIAALTLASAGSAAAANFTGEVRAATSRKLTVERSGDEVSFERTPETAVSGKRSSWAEIEVGDTVAVSWKLADKPPRAYHVTVIRKHAK